MTPLYSWDHTYTHGDQWQRREVYGMFLYAVAERLAAANFAMRLMDVESCRGHAALNKYGIYSFSGYADSRANIAMETPANSSIVRGASKMQTAWKDLQYLTIMLAGQYIEAGRDFSGYGGDTWASDVQDYYTHNVGRDVTPTDEVHAYPFPAPLVLRSAVWPPPDGFTRKRPREITTLSAPGSAGQRARFVWRFGYTIEGPYQVQSNQAPVLTTTTTPAGEKQYSRKFFDHNGSTWVLSSDQSSPADVLTLHGPIQQGDIFGPWILNELRDALNALTCTFVTYYGGRLPPNPDDPLDVAIDAQSHPAYPDGPSDAGIIYNESYDRSPGGFEAVSIVPVVSPPAICARKATFYADIRSASRDHTLFAAGGSGYSIRSSSYPDANDDPRYDQVNKIGEASASSDDFLVCGGRFGDTSSGPGGANYSGWASDAGSLFAVVDWSVSGGFQYVAGRSPSSVPEVLPTNPAYRLPCVTCGSQMVRPRGTATISYTLVVTANPLDPQYNRTYTGSGRAEIQTITTVPKTPSGTQSKLNVSNDANTRAATYTCDSGVWTFYIAHEDHNNVGGDVLITATSANGTGTATAGSSGSITATLAPDNAALTLGSGSSITVTIDDGGC